MSKLYKLTIIGELAELISEKKQLELRIKVLEDILTELNKENDDTGGIQQGTDRR